MCLEGKVPDTTTSGTSDFLVGSQPHMHALVADVQLQCGAAAAMCQVSLLNNNKADAQLWQWMVHGAKSCCWKAMQVSKLPRIRSRTHIRLST